jgi:hypothetical protein
MIASIHQPHFLPWMGYMNKALTSDVFVWLHAVQYRKNYYQNRTKIKNTNEQPLWLTLPVHASLGMNIDQITIAEPRWRERVHKTLEQCYRKTPFFAECWPPLAQAIQDAGENLNEVNFRTFTVLLQLLGGSSVQVRAAGDLPAAATDPTLRLVEVCTAVGATHYVAGKGGHNYLRVEEFDRAGIRVVWQDFDPGKVVYQQAGKVFLPGLSVIDCLFNVGPVKTREIVMGAWTPGVDRT